MKAIILAAGIGSRLRPITDSVPKCMVKVNGEMIIDRQIQELIDNKIEDIYVIAGYKYEKLSDYISIKYPNVNIIYNDVYDSTNNMYSLFLAKSVLNSSSFILLNADVFIDRGIVKQIVDSNEINSIICEKGLYNEESMKIVFNSKIERISKKITENDSYGVSIDIYKFSREASVNLFEIVSDYIINKSELNMWTEVALDRLLDKCDFQPIEISTRWMEIDNHEDLKIAEKIFR